MLSIVLVLCIAMVASSTHVATSEAWYMGGPPARGRVARYEAGGGGTARWTWSGVKLYIPDDPSGTAYAEVSVPVSLPIANVDPSKIWFWCKVTDGAWTPYIILEIKDKITGLLSRVNTDADDAAGYASWKKYNAGNSPQWQDDVGNWHLWAWVQTEYADDTVVRIYIELSGLQGPITAYVK